MNNPIDEHNKHIIESLLSVDLESYIGKQVSEFLKNDITINGSLTWYEEYPGQLHGLYVQYDNGVYLMILPRLNGAPPIQQSETREYNLEAFKEEKIAQLIIIANKHVIKWLHNQTPVKIDETKQLSVENLIAQVKTGLKPGAKNWVLFSNGTYIFINDALADKKRKAVELMQACGPAHGGSPAGDFSVMSLKAGGWLVGGHCEGMYTYVHPTEIEGTEITDIAIGLYGRAKREKDGNELEIIYVSE